MLVITPSWAVAHWAAAPIAIDPHNAYCVSVLGPEHLPSFETPEQASEALGLALLWALSQRSQPPEQAARAAHLVTLAARTRSDQLFVSCYDALRERLDQAVLEQLEKLMQFDPQNLATEFSRKHVTSGLITEAISAVFDNLETRGFTIPTKMRERIASTTDLDRLREWRRKAITIKAIEELLQD